ncbi:hypothetical protein OCGS_2367 [Oceaniovalibus guishaninsula JLT2003]|uniref:GP-PDE domain-containing protein n=1 Tax=Oceaniovalibus guishaninsula JLT2003 TaxID=1231392 RepID=K2I478_9RHOB|nr:glycerophosphodiester phosphodiesterase family protein [Oceaniovalibus guishaninsula]EKE43635.1 hypothetical protein OCGS_2367 [Oceaniovalibus guishaninsula JLT2003]
MPVETGFPYLDTGGPIAFPHRGFADGCAENTAEAIDAAVAMGFTHVETDVQATRDGVAVLFHDDRTDRLMGRPGRIADRDWSDWRDAAVAGGGRLTRLDAVLSDHPRLNLNLDAKTDGAVAPTIRAIAGADAVERVCIGSFDIRRTRAIRDALGPRLCWSPAQGGVARHWLRGWGLPLATDGAPVLQIPTHWHGIPLVTRRLLKAAHGARAHVHVWTIDDPADMERLLDLGVDGVMSDRADTLREVFRHRGIWAQSR